MRNVIMSTNNIKLVKVKTTCSIDSAEELAGRVSTEQHVHQLTLWEARSEVKHRVLRVSLLAVHVSAVVEEHAYGVDVAVARGRQQGRVAVVHLPIQQAQDPWVPEQCLQNLHVRIARRQV